MNIRVYLTIILAGSIFCSCNLKYKECKCNCSDPRLSLYNDILNELIEKHFYSYYLGDECEKLLPENNLSKKNPNLIDTILIEKESIRLQNKLFNDSNRFCTIFLDTVFRPKFPNWSLIQKDEKQTDIIKIIESISNDGQSVIDSLNTFEDQYLPSDFHLCTSKIMSLRELEKSHPKCVIGRVSLSKVYLNIQKTKGLLYCSYRCGDLCGFGELLSLEKRVDKWIINGSYLIWIS